MLSVLFRIPFPFVERQLYTLREFTFNELNILLMQLQDYSKGPAIESDVKFQLSRVTLEPMLKSMASISEQLSAPANRVAVINLKACISFL